MFIYVSSTGSLFASDEKIAKDGDGSVQQTGNDTLLGIADNFKEGWELIDDGLGISHNGSKGYSLQYVFPFLIKCFCKDMILETNEYGCVNMGEDEILRETYSIIDSEACPGELDLIVDPWDIPDVLTDTSTDASADILTGAERGRFETGMAA